MRVIRVKWQIRKGPDSLRKLAAETEEGKPVSLEEVVTRCRCVIFIVILKGRFPERLRELLNQAKKENHCIPGKVGNYYPFARRIMCDDE